MAGTAKRRESAWRHGTSLGVLAMALTAPGAALAQGAPADKEVVDEVVVTGFRASLASAINVKRQETAVVDAIKAEDIAEFPDLNLAESLQRIPGVAITRVQGEGRQVSVRGLGSEYTRVRLNGMEAIATSSGTANSGGTNRSRGFDFNIFASDLFNSLIVRKSASADVEEGSLGATVDLNTARPLDFAKPQLVLSAQGSYNDLARDVTPRFGALASKTWLDGRLGALVTVAYEERHLKEEGANITRWFPGGASGGFNAQSTLQGYTLAQLNNADSATALFHPRIPSYVSYDINNKRLGLTTSLQFKPTDRTTISLDGLYAKLEGVRKEAQLQAIGLSRSGSGKPQTILRNGVVVGRDIVQAEFDNVDLRTQTSRDELNTKFQQLTLSFSHELTDQLSIGGLAGYADSKFSSPVSTTITFDRVDSQDYAYDFRSRMPGYTLGFDPTLPGNWSMTNGTSEVRIRPSAVRNQFTTGQLFAAYEVNENLKLKAGVDYRKFEYDSQDRRRASETVVQTLTAAQLAEVSKVFSGFGRGLNVPTGSPTTWLQPDLDKFADLYGIYSNTGIYALSDITNSAARGGNEAVQEETVGLYVQAEFRGEAFGLPFRGDAGVRHFRTKQHGEGYAALTTAVQLVEARRTYDMTLPSVNLAFDVRDDLVVRAAAAKTIARPSLGSLSPGGSVSVQGANRTFSTGNPFLKPTESKNLDLSIEWYPSQGGLLAFGFFYKDINTFVQTLRRTVPYRDLGLPVELLSNPADANEDFQVTQPVNSEGGPLKGIEVNWQQPFTFLPERFGLPEWTGNFGLLANYTHVTSNITYRTSPVAGTPVVDATLVGLSKNAWNGTLYYEDSKFSIRGSIAYRSGYLTQVPGTDGNSVHGTNATTNVDLQATYNVSDQLKVSVEALNLTDEMNDLYVGESNRLNVYTHTGRQFLVGLRYAF
jgi:TonB-dependent receptor